jgi:acyl carrier protein phosphodiesterase
MHQRLADFSDTFPYVLAEDHPEDASRVAGKLVDMALERMLEILTRFSISVSGETPTPVVLDRVSRTVLTALGDHGAQYQSGLRSALAQEEELGHVGREVARLVAAVKGASESQRPDLEQDLASLRVTGLRLSECVRRWTAIHERQSIEVLGGVSSVD